jgi:FAD/FMN-containing dehydrogenase
MVMAMTDDLVERLEHRAKTCNGAIPVGAGDGGTYVIGYYDAHCADDDAAAAARIRELEVKLDAALSGIPAVFLEKKP